MFKFILKTINYFLLLLVVGCSENEGELKETQEYFIEYTEPDYPAKESGRYINYLKREESIHIGGNGIPELNILAGIKVKFNYNQKNYVKSIELFDDCNQLYQTKEIEYNNQGKAHRIKNFTVNKMIDSYFKFEYDSFNRLIKKSFYENTNFNNIFELSYLTEFEYPSEDTIIVYYPLKSNNFKQGNYYKYVLDSIGNIKYELSYSKESKLQYMIRYFFSRNYQLYSETGLPNFDFPYSLDNIETLSKTAFLGSQQYKYISKDEFLPTGEIYYYDNIDYNCNGYPVRIRGLSIGYVDL